MKLPRDVSGAECVRVLRRLGFEVTRQEGSHVRLSRAGQHVTVAQHRALLPKTLQSTLRQAGVSVAEFLALR